MKQRQKMKIGEIKTPQEQRAEDRENQGGGSISKKSTKKQAAEKEAKKSKEMTLNQFFDLMVECAPETCMETGERLTYKLMPKEVCAHILPKKPTAVPSMAKNPLNIVYLNIAAHHKMDADLGVKSEGNYVRSMKIFPLLKERVKLMWPKIPKSERKNIPQFLKPE